MRSPLHIALVSAAALLCASHVHAQLADLQPGRNFTAVMAFGAGHCENGDFGDVDNDGDLDCANGGDASDQLARIFINNGTGSFTDQTATRFAGFPVIGGRDIEFMDVESDGDLDVYVSAHTNGGASSGQVSRFFINKGGAQGGTVGFYQDETATRWGTLTSVPVGDQVCGGCNTGPFRDWSCDCDFGDLNDDGHVDLFHSSYGPGIDGSRSSRIFLNNGAGVFNELYPWANAGADTETHTIDTDLADFDGDFDVWLTNYNANTDRALRNDGPVAGGFKFTQVDAWIANDPGSDESEVDFADYDNDGDLDAFLANFGGMNHLYQSNLAQGGQGGGLYHRTGVIGGQAPSPELPSNFNSGQSLDGEWGDLDNDGDFDIALFNDITQGNWIFKNILGVPDTHAPSLYQVTVQGDKPNGTDTVIHAQIRDNCPGEWLTNYFDWNLVYTVNGGAPSTVSMIGQFGSQARGVIPAQTNATIVYHVEVTDLEGNTGVSSNTTFFQGTATWTILGGGLAGVSGIPSLVGTGPLTPGSPGNLSLTSAKPSSLCVLYISLSSSPTNFKCGTLVAFPIVFQFMLFTNGAGNLTVPWASWPSGLSGQNLYFQYAIADPAAICGASISKAVRASVP
jgi:hypothetical protein